MLPCVQEIRVLNARLRLHCPSVDVDCVMTGVELVEVFVLLLSL
jgi:hypothetical protein